MLFVFTLFAAQLVRIQVIDADAYSAKGLSVRSTSTVEPAARGAIEDRYGITLAHSVERYDVFVDQRLVGTYTRVDPTSRTRERLGVAGAAAALAPLLGTDTGELTRELSGTEQWRPLARGVEPAVWRSIRALEIPGVSGEQTSVRAYPGGAPTAATLGWTGAEGEAKGTTGAGLELSLDDRLAGTPGKTYREKSSSGLPIPMGRVAGTPAVPGTNVRLTLDSDLNYYAFAAIKEQVEVSDADWGSVVVMDRHGRLRALAQWPTFDPADRDPKNRDPKNRDQKDRDRDAGGEGTAPDAPAGKDADTRAREDRNGSSPFQDVFEPGSTAKVMSIGAALDQGVVTPTTPFEVPNRLARSDRKFRDSHDHETLHLTTAGVLAQSSNIGTILAAEKVAPADLERYYRGFGVGQPSAVGFPGESLGLFKPAPEWQGSERYTVMFGQGMAMSAVQAAGVFQTIANGGVRVPASLVEGTISPDGEYTPAPLPEGERVVSQETARQLSIMLRAVVSGNGTASQAAIPGIPVAGKTGTAEQFSGPAGVWAASFAGFSPADDPQYVVGVTLYNPKNGHLGGATAGPVFQKVMTYALQKSGAVPSGSEPALYPLKVGETVDPSAPRVEPGAVPNEGPVPPGRATRDPRPVQSAQPTRSTQPTQPGQDGQPTQPTAAGTASAAARRADAAPGASASR